MERDSPLGSAEMDKDSALGCRRKPLGRNSFAETAVRSCTASAGRKMAVEMS